jgi:hypothetical protein
MKSVKAVKAARAWLWAHVDADNEAGNSENTKGAWAVINWVLGDAASSPPWEEKHEKR